MRRLTLLISIALALVAVAIPATASAKRSHHRTHRARVADRNHNGIPDRWERRFRVHSATADPDHDGVSNLGEFHNGTNPRMADSNGNGIPDGQDDANGDGVPDGQEQAGTVTSFDGTTLLITMVNGSTQQGAVDSTTEIECEDNTPTTTATTRDGGDQSSTGTTDSSGQTEPGDDNPQTSPTPPSTSGDDETQGDDDQGDTGDDQGGDQQSSGCDATALQPGTIVKEAELRLTSSGPVFEKIHLGGKAPA